MRKKIGFVGFIQSTPWLRQKTSDAYRQRKKWKIIYIDANTVIAIYHHHKIFLPEWSVQQWHKLNWLQPPHREIFNGIFMAIISQFKQLNWILFQVKFHPILINLIFWGPKMWDILNIIWKRPSKQNLYGNWRWKSPTLFYMLPFVKCYGINKKAFEKYVCWNEGKTFLSLFSSQNIYFEYQPERKYYSWKIFRFAFHFCVCSTFVLNMCTRILLNLT